VLLNVVSNAIKFTERGSVAIRVENSPGRDGKEGILFRVVDTGIGIPPDKQNVIFEPFRQADESTTRRYGGSGLGLSISAALIERMGGRIWMESEPGRGSAFYFTAPLPRAEDPRANAGDII